MIQISQETREAILQKALNQNGRTQREIAATHNIGFSTLQKWLKQRRDETGSHQNTRINSTGKLNPAERFQHLIATETLDEAAQGVYCRKHGLYSFQLTQWKDEFMSKNDERKALQGPTAAEFKALQAENMLLKKELRRKDSALAETAALLVLKKKVNILLGEDEDA